MDTVTITVEKQIVLTLDPADTKTVTEIVHRVMPEANGMILRLLDIALAQIITQAQEAGIDIGVSGGWQNGSKASH